MPRKKQKRNRPRKHTRAIKIKSKNEKLNNTRNFQVQSSNVAIDEGKESMCHKTSNLCSKYTRTVQQKLYQLIKASRSPNQMKFNSWKTPQKRRKTLKALATKEFIALCENETIVHPRLSLQNVDCVSKMVEKEYLLPLFTDGEGILKKMVKLLSKYGRGIFLVVFDNPSDIKLRKLSKMAFVFGYQLMDHDDDTIFSDYISWVSQKKLQAFLRFEIIRINDSINTFYKNHGSYNTCDTFINLPLLTVVFYNPIYFDVHLTYWSSMKLFHGYGKLGQSIQNLNTCKASYRNINTVAPQFMKEMKQMVDNFCGDDASPSQKQEFAQMLTRNTFAHLSHLNRSKNQSTLEQINIVVEVIINFVFPKNIIKLLESSPIAPMLRLNEISQLLNEIHSETTKTNLRYDLKRFRNSNDDIELVCANHDRFRQMAQFDSISEYYQQMKHLLFTDDEGYFNIACSATEVIENKAESNKMLHNTLFNANQIAKKVTRKMQGNYCDWCKKTEKLNRSQGNGSLLKCSNCSSAWYCSEQCQRNHWKDSHRDQCKLMSKIV